MEDYQIDPFEKSFAWLSESLSQSILGLIFTFLIGQSILFEFLGKNYPDWVYYIGLIWIWIIVMILSLMVSLLTYRHRVIRLGGTLQLGGIILLLTVLIIVLPEMAL
jgi:hypothetical protein